MDDDRSAKADNDGIDRMVEPDLRSVRRGAWRFITLGIAAIALLIALIVVLMKPKPAPVVSIVETPVAPTVRILDASWTVDEKGMFTIAGQIENGTMNSIHVVTLSVLFYDEAHSLIATTSPTIDVPTALQPGGHHPFSVSGPHDARYKAADYRVESWN